MGRGIGRLSGADLRRSKPGMKCDGGGLWLQTTAAKDGGWNRSWVFRFTLNGVTRHAGLGSLITVSLKDARERARQFRLLVLDGIDPIAHRDAERATRIAAQAKTMSFEQAALAYISAHRSTWRNEEHAQQWPASLRRYAFPVLGKIDVAKIDTPLIVRSLEKIWQPKQVTASRLRGRIESILDWATVSGFRSGDNPARWSGHLEHLLAAPGKRRIEHHAALPWREVPAFMQRLREIKTVAARALEFAILTAARAGEVRGAVWSEIGADLAVWSVPAARMKAGKEHRVPLSARCVEILREMAALRTDDTAIVFAGRDGQSKFGESIFRHLLNTLDRTDITVHGFRSSFRDWCGESTNYPREIAEAALAHISGDATERAYRRGDALDKRRQLMEAWARFCAEPAAVSGEVISIGAAR
jgi:integrase